MGGSDKIQYYNKNVKQSDGVSEILCIFAGVNMKISLELEARTLMPQTADIKRAMKLIRGIASMRLADKTLRKWKKSNPQRRGTLQRQVISDMRENVSNITKFNTDYLAVPIICVYTHTQLYLIKQIYAHARTDRCGSSRPGRDGGSRCRVCTRRGFHAPL